jgi:methyltransferase (TIGR00027 family)
MPVQTPLLEQQVSNVSATAFITLFARATESQSAQPIIDDPQAAAIAAQLRPALAQSDRDLCQRLAAGKLEPMVVVTVSQRARHFDKQVRAFCARHPDAVIVNLGCGLDTRFFRIDDGHLLYYDLDLPPMIELKRTLVQEQPRYRFVACSVLDHAWMDALAELGDRQFLFLAEGLFMYLPPADVQALVVELARRFPGSELVAEVFNNFWLREPWKGWVNRKMQRRLGFSADAGFQSGVDNERHCERWGHGIRFLDDWAYYDDQDPKLRGLNWMRHVQFLRHMQWTVHYRLGDRR